MRALLFAFLFLFFTAPAYADCALVPSGSRPEGHIFYNVDQKVFQYCDGTDWVAMNHVAGSGSGGCPIVPSGSRDEGRVIYNADHRVLQGCAGNVWRPMGPIGGVPGLPFAQISAGDTHTCAIKTDGTAWCWGAGDDGQLGDGNSEQAAHLPVQISEAGPWAVISAADAHTCAIKTDGTAWCWGRNTYGRLGDGTIGGTTTTPAQITEAGPWAEIAAGTEHTCAIKVDGTAWCWGRGLDGRLGNEDTADYGSAQQVTEAGPWDKITVRLGSAHSCAIKSDGTAWCWGNGTNGELGNGQSIDYSSAQQISEAGPWDSISVGQAYSCAIKSDGTAWCWGADWDGELGNGASGSTNTPMQITEPGPWSTITAGQRHTCGIKDDNSAWCWGEGDNGFGKLGTGSTVNEHDPVQITEPGPWSAISAGTQHTCAKKSDNSTWCWGSNGYGQLGQNINSKIPIKVAEPGPWSQVSASHLTSCALKTDNSAWCWGGGSWGSQGDGTGITKYSPVTIAESGPWDFIDAGESHGCAVKSDGTAWCWGGNWNGHLGDGTTTTSTVPVQVSESGPWDMISAGFGRFTCALKSAGTAWCWGVGTNGQLGNGQTLEYHSAQQVSDAGPWDSVSAGAGHACGVKSDGTAWCWGSDTWSKLGNGATTGDQTTPVQEASSATNWSNISAGNTHTCAIKTDGTAWCWGGNWLGQIGDGSTAERDSPTQISEAGPWDSVSAGSNHSCAIKSDGTAWCWGYNGAGRLGINNTTNQLDPVQISEPGPWAAISAGDLHTCALKTDNSVWCWGFHDSGRLGYGDVSQPVAGGVGGNCGIGSSGKGEGQIFYNSSSKMMSYCAGAGFVGIGPELCNRPGTPVGTLCSDGTYYAGLSPDGNVKMFMADINSETLNYWNDDSSNYTLTSITSTTDGDDNTATLIITDADSVVAGTQPHRAAHYCNDLSAHGHSDWYLPAQDELNLIWNGGTPVGDIKIDGTWYWSSTEDIISSAWVQKFDDGTQNQGVKLGFQAVRCVRK